MDSWISYLKRGFSRKLAEDQIAGDKEYRSIREGLRPFVPMILRHWKMGAVAAGGLMAGSLLTFPQPMITRYLMDHVLIEKQLALLAPVIALLAAVVLGQKISGILQSFFTTRFQQNVTLDIQKELLERTLSLPKAFFDKIQTGYLVSRIQNGVGGVQWFFSGTVVQVLTQSIRFIGGLVFLFYLEWRIAVPVTLSLPLTWFVARYMSRRTYVLSHHSMECNSAVSGRFQEAFSSVPLIKAFSKERHTIGHLVDGLKSAFGIALEQQSMGFVNNVAIQALPGLARFFVLIFGSYWVIKGDWTVGSLLAFQAYLGYVYGPAQFLVNMNYQFQTSRASLERISALFDAMPEDNVGVGEKIDGPLGDITFKNVCFSYDGREQVLHGVYFTVKRGQKVAVVGPSGAGKTTLISLLLRFYRPTSGEIYYDGRPASVLETRALRRRFGYVPQETTLLSGSIMKNLRYGNEDATEAEVQRAAKAAEIHGVISRLPEGYDTIVGERGASLSEGQKQRISIARALIRDPDVLIMDEPTSSLDANTEAAIFLSLPKMFADKTVFIISHRETPIQGADSVIRLDGKGMATLHSK
ncbi:ABC transporter, ATP-binding protein [delta proteobacterium NaphS2]|nr:ABC transporter, ATP-binding protein [delta proteobacterium NaphS2]